MSGVAQWVLAVSPVILLLGLVIHGRISSAMAATLTLTAAAIVGVAAFGARAEVLGVALAKGAWLGFWILMVVWPALLLYRVSAAAGLERIGEVVASVLPERQQALLVCAWLLPSFIQGVAGFGTPVAVAAPLLVSLGWSPLRAIVLVLIGYQWSVTFGSMGSSFYMASLTAGLDTAAEQGFALRASSMLAVNCLLSGALVLLLDGGPRALRSGYRTLLAVGLPMATALILVAVAVPAVATLAATSAGFIAVLLLGRRRNRHPNSGPVDGGVTTHRLGKEAVSIAPYGLLLATALPVFLVPPVRRWVETHLVLAPSFPATSTEHGWTNAAVSSFTPLKVLAHPGVFVVTASVLGYLIFLAVGFVSPAGIKKLMRAWLGALPRASTSILVLGMLAMVLVDTGMINILARGAADISGTAYPVVAPAIGALGSFTTGSTTSSNALFSALQVEVAHLGSLSPLAMLAGQTVGGNVGNAIAPVVILVGLGALEIDDDVGSILRASLPPVGVLMAFTVLMTVLWTTV